MPLDPPTGECLWRSVSQTLFSKLMCPPQQSTIFSELFVLANIVTCFLSTGRTNGKLSSWAHSSVRMISHFCIARQEENYLMGFLRTSTSKESLKVVVPFAARKELRDNRTKHELKKAATMNCHHVQKLMLVVTQNYWALEKQWYSHEFLSNQFENKTELGHNNRTRALLGNIGHGSTDRVQRDPYKNDHKCPRAKNLQYGLSN